MHLKLRILLLLSFATLSFANCPPCPTGTTLASFENQNSFLTFPGPGCSTPPPSPNPNDHYGANQCYVYDDAYHSCRWMHVGQAGGFASCYYKGCSQHYQPSFCQGAEQVDYGAAHRCILPPSKTACLCVPDAVHVTDCLSGEVAVYKQGEEVNCIPILPPPKRNLLTSLLSPATAASPPDCQTLTPDACECPIAS